MKILVSGSDKIYAIENFYVKYLRELGIDIFHFSAQSIFYDFYQKGIINKLLFKSGLSTIYKKINEQFINTVDDFKPDIIWVFKGMEIYPGSLKYAKEKKIRLVNFNGDSPFIFSGKGSGNANVKKSIALYDLHLTYNTAVKKEMEAEYKIQTAILPFGYDVSDEVFEMCCKQEEVMKACFLGNPDKERGQFLETLAANGIRLDVYGNHWKKYVTDPGITVFDPVLGDEVWKVLRKYRVQLNLMRPHNPDTHNMRSFEVPGIGGIQLAPDTYDHKTYFEPGKEIFLYKNIEECIQQIKKILALPVTAADLVRQEARMRSIGSAYSYKDRTKQVLEKMKMLYE